MQIGNYIITMFSLLNRFFIFTSFVFLFFFYNCSQKQWLKEAKKHYKKGYSDYSHYYDEKEQSNQIRALKSAEDEFKESIKYAILSLDGKYKSLMALSHKLIEVEMYYEAVEPLKKSSSIRPQEVMPYYLQALCYINYSEVSTEDQKAKFLERGEELYQIAYKLSSNYLPLLRSMGIFYGIFKNDYKKAKFFFNRVQRIAPNDVPTLFALGRVYYNQGYLNKAKEQYVTILNLVDSDSEQAKNARKNLLLLNESR